MIETKQGWAHMVLLRQVNLDCSVEIWEEGMPASLASTELLVSTQKSSCSQSDSECVVILSPY